MVIFKSMRLSPGSRVYKKFWKLFKVKDLRNVLYIFKAKDLRNVLYILKQEVYKKFL